MIRIKPGVNILEMLRRIGYTSYTIRRDRIFGEATVQKLRSGGIPSWNELDKLCDLLRVQPWDLIEYVPNKSPGE